MSWFALSFSVSPCWVRPCCLRRNFAAPCKGRRRSHARGGSQCHRDVLKNIDTRHRARLYLRTEPGTTCLAFVAPGSYSVTVKAPGFKTTVRDDIRLSINDNLSIDMELPLGQASETVQVTGELTTVQSESSSLGSVIPEKIVTSMPLERPQQPVHVHDRRRASWATATAKTRGPATPEPTCCSRPTARRPRPGKCRWTAFRTR